MIRSPGLAGDPPEWFGRDGDVPRAVHAGPWIPQYGQFFDGWRRAEHAELPAVAAARAARTGWVKLIADWGPDDEPIPADVLAAAVTAVHAAGGRRRCILRSGRARERSRRGLTRLSTGYALTRIDLTVGRRAGSYP